jgi:hypothetical protein
VVGFSLEGWTGDNADEVVGRKPNTLLVALTSDGDVGVDWPSGPYENGKLPKASRGTTTSALPV